MIGTKLHCNTAKGNAINSGIKKKKPNPYFLGPCTLKSSDKNFRFRLNCLNITSCGSVTAAFGQQRLAAYLDI